MKKPVTIVILSLFLSLLSAAPYMGISQAPISTSVEIGYLTKSIDQNIAVSLPTLGALESDDDWYRYPVASLNLFFKKRVGTTLAVGVGSTMRMGWEYSEELSLQAGFALQLSLETPGVMDILFCELAYLPKWLKWSQGEDSAPLLDKGIGQFVRFGYRRAF